MKNNIIYPSLLLISGIVSAQSDFQLGSKIAENIAASRELGNAGINPDLLTYNKMIINGLGGAKIPYESIEGSPYLHQEFKKVEIPGIDKKLMARYNAYEDHIEIKSEDQIYALSKISPYTNFIFPESMESIQYINTGNDNSGYFLTIADGKNKILKKYKVEFKNSTPAKSGYDQSTGPSFYVTDNNYYLYTSEKTLVRLPKNSKDFINHFPEYHQILEKFFKENKVKLNNENDQKKIINFLNSL